MRNVLVTGGAGFIGSVLVRDLEKVKGVKKIIVLDNLSRGKTLPPEHFGNPEYKFIKGDIRNSSLLDKTLGENEIDTVFHLAAIVGDPACAEKPDEARQINVDAVKKIVGILLKNNVERVIFASSCSVYGLQQNDIIVNEDSDLNPTSLYGITKLEAERIFRQAQQENGLNATILRLSTIYGPSPPPSMRFDLFVNLFVLNAIVNKKIKVYGGSMWRPLLYTRDVASAFISVASAPLVKVSGKIYNVGDNTQNFTIKKVANVVAEEIPGTTIVEEDRSPDQRSYKVNFDKISEELNFKAQFDLRKGIRELSTLIKNGAYGNMPLILGDEICVRR